MTPSGSMSVTGCSTTFNIALRRPAHLVRGAEKNPTSGWYGLVAPEVRGAGQIRTRPPHDVCRWLTMYFEEWRNELFEVGELMSVSR